MDNRIPALQYALFAEAFWKFASMARQYHFYEDEVNCRIGSLESQRRDLRDARCVNCRIGSLESSRK